MLYMYVSSRKITYVTFIFHSWRVGPWHECTQTCGGGHAWRTVICVDTYLDGTQRVVDSKECKSHQPSRKKSCSNQLCPTWYAGDWTPVS